MKKMLFASLILFSIQGFSQNTDTIRVLSYNLLNFPNVNSGRIADLKVIVQEAVPDILMVCELTSSAGSSAILNDALNENGITHYQNAQYVSGPDTENMLYYNDDKLELLEQHVISTQLRDINEYVLYYKSDDITTTDDTTFFYVYVCHLKASQGYEADRNAEIAQAKLYMAGRPGLENVLLGGDFNLYGSSEPSWNTILSGSGVLLVDPVNVPGNWHSDWGYATHHTQSTRTNSIDGGAGGGMDDRFDFIFMSPDLMNWGNQAKMIDGSYWAYGQDGNHFNGTITDAPTNTTLPWAVIQALHDMSDHLPVYTEIEVQRTFNNVPDLHKGVQAFYNPVDYQIQFTSLGGTIETGSIYIFDLSGKEIAHFNEIPENGKLDVSFLEHGVYFLKETHNGFSMKFVR